MRFHISYGVLALVLGASATHAQTVYPGPIVAQPAGTIVAAPPAVVQPAETVRTTRTVHTVRRLVPVRDRIVTTRTVTRSVIPTTPAVVAGSVAAAPTTLYDTAVPAAAPAPLYGTAAPVPVAAPLPPYGYADYGAPLYGTAAPVAVAAPVRSYGYADYSAPLYDVAPAAIAPAVAPAPVVAAPIAAPVATAPVIYRYVYEPDRILVIDPVTNIAVQAIPR